MSATILLVEDNPDIQTLNRRALTRHGYHVVQAETLAQGKALFEQEKPSLIILDIMLPDGNGLELCEELRANSKTPVLFLSALGKDEEILEGFKVGGDDYLPKPYDLNLLLAKVEVILRRQQSIPETITKGTLTLRVTSDEAFVGDRNLDLRKKEFSLLCFFAENENRYMTAEYIYEQVWGQPMADDNNAYKSTMRTLRKKLEGSGYVITNDYGKGYCFEKG